MELRKTWNTQRIFSTFSPIVPTPLEQTRWQNIPEAERTAYWLAMGAEPHQIAEISEHDLQTLHLLWLQEQQRRQRPHKVVLHLVEGVLQTVYFSHGEELEICVLDEATLIKEGLTDDLERQDFLYRATSYLWRKSNAREINSKDPYP